MYAPYSLRAFWQKNDFLIICAFIVFAFTVYHRLDNINFWKLPRYVPCDGTPYYNYPDRFSGNVNYEVDIPDIVHYIRFGQDAKCFTQEQVNSLLSVVENHQPSTIYIHTDDVMSVQKVVSKLFSYRIKRLIDVQYYPRPKHAFGLNFSDEFDATHKVDFTKLKILRRYGGIFMDNNVYVLRNLRKFLKFEMTVVLYPNPEDGEIQVELTDHVIVAHKDARFLNLWLKTYHEYNGQEPKHVNSSVMKTLLKKFSKYVHILENDMPPNVDMNGNEFKKASNSRKYYFVVANDDKSRCIS